MAEKMMGYIRRVTIVMSFLFLFILWMEAVAMLVVGMAKLVIWFAGG